MGTRPGERRVCRVGFPANAPRSPFNDRIIHRPEMPGNVLVKHFVIGNGGLQIRVPVHQSLTAVNQVHR
jgi:hypothetical protein